MQLKFELMAFRHLTGRKDPSKSYTIAEGIAELPNGTRAFCEVFMSGTFNWTPGPHMMEMEISVNRDRRIEVRAISIRPQVGAAKAA